MTPLFDEYGREVQSFEVVGGVPTYELETIIVEHRRAINVAGGGSTANAWTGLPITDLVHDSSGLASIGSNVLTVPAGVYLIRAKHVFTAGASALARIRIVGGTTLVSLNHRIVTNGQQITVEAEGVVFSTVGRTYTWEYYITSAQATNGLGLPVNNTYHETYGHMVLTRLKSS